MKNKEQWSALIKERELLYRFLGGLYIMEVDEQQLEAMKSIRFPEVEGDEDADLDLREGYELMGQYVTGISTEDLEELAADYAKVFLAAGDATGKAAFPYESVYVDKKHQVGGSTEMQMRALYLERGWQPDPDVYRTMYDNIGLMLEYMGIICKEEQESLERDDDDHLRELLLEQRTFLKKHITNWVFSFTSDIVKFAETDFYKGVARITNGFIKKEVSFLKEDQLWDIA